MNKKSLEEWFKLPDETRLSIFKDISGKTGLPESAIEKDWWAVRTLEIIFETKVADKLVFKGGTSLSKAWGLIKRFSEDIDLALDKNFLGFEGNLSRTQVDRLREKSFAYLTGEFYDILKDAFKESGFIGVELSLKESTSSDQDPIQINIKYKSITEKYEYINPRVQIEIGSRSLIEPYTKKAICSFVGEYYKGREFADENIMISTVNPERTFLEKIFLIHEEFQQAHDKIKTDRLSRHFYDIEKLIDTEYAETAFKDKELYNHIVEHRKTIAFIRGIDYSNHTPAKINIVPPKQYLSQLEKDYKEMKESMIYGNSPSFEDLIDRIKKLNSRINNL
ncbi:MAG: nucleotidyl transferase AbiEii/AbiGii toxin family protein [Ignavibacteria bacterium]|nr:nucleotidyl transferase AbiEii/AbiGii toxin family protein [Ignavibacteria bacterium]